MYTLVAVRFLGNTTAGESDESVIFTLVSSFPSNDPFVVEVFTMILPGTTADGMST